MLLCFCYSFSSRIHSTFSKIVPALRGHALSCSQIYCIRTARHEFVGKMSVFGIPAPWLPSCFRKPPPWLHKFSDPPWLHKLSETPLRGRTSFPRKKTLRGCTSFPTFKFHVESDRPMGSAFGVERGSTQGQGVIDSDFLKPPSVAAQVFPPFSFFRKPPPWLHKFSPPSNSMSKVTGLWVPLSRGTPPKRRYVPPFCPPGEIRACRRPL